MICCIDIGGTHTRVGISKDGKTFINKIRFDTDQDPVIGIKNIITNVKGLTPIVTQIICTVPGTLTSESVLLSVPNLPHWQGVDIFEQLHEVFKVIPIFINDALAAALGEANWGSGKDFSRVGFLTVSTGVGGALVINKHIQLPLAGFEPGRQIIDYKKELSLQDLVSGASVRKETGKSPREVHEVEYWEEKARILAVGIWNMVVHWSPDIIVVGGPMVLGSPAVNLNQAIMRLKEINHDSLTLPIILPAILADDAGLLGCLAINQTT